MAQTTLQKKLGIELPDTLSWEYEDFSKDPKKLDAVKVVTEDEIVRTKNEYKDIIQSLNTSPDKIAHTYKLIHYIKLRENMRLGRIAAFMMAFPERSVYSGSNKAGFKAHEDKKIGDLLGYTTIESKAKYVEISKIYNVVKESLMIGTHLTFAFDRMRVLDKALDKIFDNDVNDRDKGVYMKLFLEETKKPESLKKIEHTYEMGDNFKEYADKLDNIAGKLAGMDGADIIDAIVVGNQIEHKDKE